MPVSIVSFGGKFGFIARNYLPKLSFNGFFFLKNLMHKKIILSYMQRCFVLDGDRYLPIFVNIETINRCNGKCSFCSANSKNEKRPYKIMNDRLFEKIIDELSEFNYSNFICLYVNNEPFLDKRMPEMLKLVRTRLPYSTVLVFTNGTLLTKEILDGVADCVDIMHVNNYNDTYELTKSSRVIYDHIKKNESHYSNMNVVIQLRYIHEYLTNRAGTAPNRSATKKVIKVPCILPFTDLTIFPDGIVGLCCNDALEKTNFGDVNKQNVLEIFHGNNLKKLREMMYNGRNCVQFCKHCDYIDGGMRLNHVNQLMLL